MITPARLYHLTVVRLQMNYLTVWLPLTVLAVGCVVGCVLKYSWRLCKKRKMQREKEEEQIEEEEDNRVFFFRLVSGKLFVLMLLQFPCSAFLSLNATHPERKASVGSAWWI